MALTVPERRFLPKYIETDDPSRQIAAWRASGCKDGSDAQIRQWIRDLAARSDAQGYLGYVRANLDIVERAQLRAQATNAAQAEVIRREVQTSNLVSADRVRQYEEGCILAGERKSVQGFARLVGQIESMTGAVVSGAGLSRREAEEAYGKAQAQVGQDPEPPRAAESDKPAFIAILPQQGGPPRA